MPQQEGLSPADWRQGLWKRRLSPTDWRPVLCMRGFHLRTEDQASAREGSHLQTRGWASARGDFHLRTGGRYSARGALTYGLEAGTLQEALTCGLEAGPLQEKVLCYGDHLAFPLLVVSENLHTIRYCRVYINSSNLFQNFGQRPCRIEALKRQQKLARTVYLDGDGGSAGELGQLEDRF
jgi:hypothetical protein